jgi:hypothetical protein
MRNDPKLPPPVAATPLDLTADPAREEFEARALKEKSLAARKEEVERMKERARIKQRIQAMRGAGY